MRGCMVDRIRRRKDEHLFRLRNQDDISSVICCWTFPYQQGAWLAGKAGAIDSMVNSLSTLSLSDTQLFRRGPLPCC